MRKIVATLLTLLAAGAATAQPFSGVHFFGDSLTDTGNVTTVYAAIPHPPGAPAVVPGPPYDPEGRASNGPLYADVLAQGLGFSALASQRGGSNYAYGGARTRYQLFGPPFLGINDQVAQFRALPGAADPHALYVLWAGANNLQDIFLGRTTDPLGQPIPTLSQTLDDIDSMLNGLADEGARHLLVPNVPNLGRVPRVRELGGAPGQAAATALVQAFNGELDTLLDGFAASHPDVHLIRFDSYASFEGIVANAATHGLTNLTDRCYTGDDLGFTGGGSVCEHPDQYLFWDGIHPTAVTHRLLGEAMLAAAVVPEPATVLLLAFGLSTLAWRSASRSRALTRT
ncbi:SGNH/GDSL hydrolase family protein [Piscinibacter sp. XHJ-5]|uniref:SGNH/GDSL hydrolase family protein n=1 Tax=Piscinibacter sp. XHJ-5 TaxID=3037797 RepID=UPI0024533A30|nr:SGNH/GDSL hydrolase family protein [Piscinibacter sp. XHJ-5]